MRNNTFINSVIVLISIFTILSVFNLDTVSAHMREDKLINVTYKDLSPQAKKQVECLAQNIYYEAGWEPEEGQVAVAMVTMNRVEDGRFGNSICGVVKQKVQNTCQFTWFCEHKTLTNINHNVYNDVKNLAAYVYANYEKMDDPSKGALFYHADYVNPGWKNMRYLAKIGHHKFYNRKENV
jgi:spore germination cell wall hydrolase CwlJ-like protein